MPSLDKLKLSSKFEFILISTLFKGYFVLSLTLF